MLAKSQHGVTLVELMISILIAVLLGIGLVTLFAQNKRSYYQNEDIAHLQDSGRYAVEQLGRDLSMAGFYGQLAGGDWFIPQPLAAVTGCGAGNGIYDDLALDPGDPLSDWLFAIFPRALDGFTPQQTALAVENNAANAGQFACVPLPAGLVAGSDVVALKRAIGTPLSVNPYQAPAAGRLYLSRRGSDGFLAQGSVINADASLSVDTTDPFQVTQRDYEYSPRIYYIRNPNAGDNWPNDLPDAPILCRAVLGVGPAMEEECIADGVETFQIEFGLDLSGDATANVYVSGLDTAPVTGPPEPALLVSARITVLVRSLRPDPTYLNDKVYTVGDRTLGPFNDNFYRRVFSSTVLIRNVRNLQRLGF